MWWASAHSRVFLKASTLIPWFYQWAHPSTLQFTSSSLLDWHGPLTFNTFHRLDPWRSWLFCCLISSLYLTFSVHTLSIAKAVILLLSLEASLWHLQTVYLLYWNASNSHFSVVRRQGLLHSKLIWLVWSLQKGCLVYNSLLSSVD
jgi:hypothetical protein